MSTINGGWRGPNIVQNGLVLYFDAASSTSYNRFISPTTWKDLSGNNINGTLSNGPTFDGGNEGSIQFDGVNDFVTLGNVSALNFTNGIFSVSTWFLIPSTWTAGSQYPNLICKGASAGWDTDGWSLYVFRNRGAGTGYAAGLGMRNGATALSGQEVGNLPTNTPIQFVATADGSGGNIRIYINGNLTFTGSQIINPASNSNEVVIGRGPITHWFPGTIYTIQLYDRTLTTQEVLQNFNTTRSRFGI